MNFFWLLYLLSTFEEHQKIFERNNLRFIRTNERMRFSKFSSLFWMFSEYIIFLLFFLSISNPPLLTPSPSAARCRPSHMDPVRAPEAPVPHPQGCGRVHPSLLLYGFLHAVVLVTSCQPKLVRIIKPLFDYQLQATHVPDIECISPLRSLWVLLFPCCN